MANVSIFKFYKLGGLMCAVRAMVQHDSVCGQEIARLESLTWKGCVFENIWLTFLLMPRGKQLARFVSH